ncbi:hypothetical protein AAZX31_20G076200 [Glycine max]|uniref:CCT domain-containing protein n=1 Tax=Glycine max TaxID=3847 RepID=A0A0R0E8V1_SOYBN|nr:uncharacterized protein LOC100793417 isoform X1 [Glycine max]KAH1035168.1 hypothetical protein GYH30_055239 [Glycine max]KRG90347.1 hypothetical protein GLYMA_20G085100v4 [Glycine max]
MVNMLFTMLICHHSLQDEISGPISARIFELCDPDFFPHTLQNSEVTSSSNCCHEEKSSYATTISPPLDVVDNNKFNINSNSSNIVTTTSSSTTTTSTTTNNNNNATNGNNLSIFFDTQDEIDNDISASIDFSSSPSFVVPPLLPISTQQDQFDFPSAQPQVQLSTAAGSILTGLSHYPTDPVIAPLIGAPLPSVFDDDCISSIPSYVPLNPSSPSCSYLSPGIGVYMPPPGSLNTALSADSSGLFGGNILLGSELQAHELDYQGENGGMYCTDSIQRVFNSPDLQALGNESQKLVAGAGSSATLAPEISHLEDSTLKVGKLSVEQRKEKIHRYMKKRNERNFSKKIKYACRKIRERVGVAPIVEKMVENRLRWFGHVERRPVDSVVRRVDQMERRQTIRGRGRPKKTIREVIKKDLEINGLDRSMVLDRTLWRKLIHVADPT